MFIQEHISSQGYLLHSNNIEKLRPCDPRNIYSGCPLAHNRTAVTSHSSDHQLLTSCLASSIHYWIHASLCGQANERWRHNHWNDTAPVLSHKYGHCAWDNTHQLITAHHKEGIDTGKCRDTVTCESILIISWPTLDSLFIA